MNSRADGLNLVSKEGPVVNRKQGVVILSNRAGSHVELGPGVGISPDDRQDTAAALHSALTMGSVERQERARVLRRVVLGRQAQDWLASLRMDMLRRA